MWQAAVCRSPSDNGVSTAVTGLKAIDNTTHRQHPMPWTFAHPAAILPFHRYGASRLPLSGLVVGSLAPDFGYYAGRFDLATRAHTPVGVLLICLPSAFLLVLLLRRFRGHLVAPLPDPHRTLLERLPVASPWSTVNIAGMVAAILIGAFTHIAWDAFTHANGAMVLAGTWLREPLFAFDGRTFAVYNLLQHASTLLGLFAMAVVHGRWLHRSVQAGQARWGKPGDYVPLAMAGVISGLLGLAIARLTLGPGRPHEVVIVRGVIDATLVFVVAYGCLALRAASRPANRGP
jgi:hypothetical protein